MSSSIGAQVAQLRQAIYYHIDNDMLDGAHFLAGRLQALDPRNPDSAHLLAMTCQRLGRHKAAQDHTAKHGQSGKHLGCAYVYAQTCLSLGMPMPGIKALDKARALWEHKNEWLDHTDKSRWATPDAPAVLLLKGKLWTAHGDARKAGDCFQEVHALSPLIWEALEGLCKIGADLKVDNMFRLNRAPAEDHWETETAPSQIYVDEDTRQPLAPHSRTANQKTIIHNDPFGPGKINARNWQPKIAEFDIDATETYRNPVTEWDTPTSHSINHDDISMGGVPPENADVFGEPPAAPSRRQRQNDTFDTSDRIRPPTLRAHSHSASESTQDEPLRAGRKQVAGAHKRTISGQPPVATADVTSQPRRSNRLFTQNVTSVRGTRAGTDTSQAQLGRDEYSARVPKPATGAKGRTGIVGRVVSGNRKILPPTEREKEKRSLVKTVSRTTAVPQTRQAPTVEKQVPQVSEPNVLDDASIDAILDNFRDLAVGYNALSRFDLPLAITAFQHHETRQSPWILAQTAKAYYEANEYRKAEQCFAQLLKLEPFRIEDMDIYSTVLWHLRKEIPLNWLCQLLRDTAFSAPQTWVAIGNAMSLSREHDQAISAFTRATQLDPRYAYAHTLLGHEHLTNEAYDAALAAFRRAVAIDARCYGGWYGLGKASERVARLDDAERYYRLAAAINPANPTLYVCIGVVLERGRQKEAALGNYTRALELQPGSALARFKKARVMMHLRDFEGALEELEVLRDQAPDEANVWFLLGKCYKGLGDKAEALRALTTALNLDAKAAPFIKEAMESLDDEDESDDD